MPNASGGSNIGSSSQITDEIILSADIKNDEIKNEDIKTTAGIELSKLAVDPLARANHTGTQTASTISDKATELLARSKHSGTQLAATISDLATEILARGKHTGTQTASTISDFATAVAALLPPTGFTLLKKTSTTTKTSNANYADDDTLLFAMSANKTYIVRLKVFFLMAAACDIKFIIAGPASPTQISFVRKEWEDVRATLVTSGKSVGAYADTELLATVAAQSEGLLEFDMVIQNGANAGNLSLQWAQITSSGAEAKVYKGSYLEYLQID